MIDDNVNGGNDTPEFFQMVDGKTDTEISVDFNRIARQQDIEKIDREIENSQAFVLSQQVYVGRLKREKQLKFGAVENAFPIEVYPPIIQQMINGLHGYKKEYASSSILSVLSVAVGNSLNVKVRNAYITGTPLYMVLVGSSSIGKTHPVRWLLKPLLNIEHQNRIIYENDYKQWEANGSTGKAPKMKQIVISGNLTIEALPNVLERNKRGLFINSEEILSWFRSMQSLSKMNATTEWLSIFDQDTIIVTRKTVKDEYIKKPFVSILGGIQPEVIHELYSKGNSSNGFVQRFLFCNPQDQLKDYPTKSEIEPKWETLWDQAVKRIYDVGIHDFDELGTPIPFVVELSTEANERLFNWRIENADRMNSHKNTELEFSIYGKMETILPRIALILETLVQSYKPTFSHVDNNGNRRYTPFEISNDSMNGAIKVVDYFTENAIRTAKGNVVETLTPEEQYLASLSNENVELYAKLPRHFDRKQAYAIGSEIEINRVKVSNFLRNTKLFVATTRGNYKKIFHIPEEAKNV